MLINIITIYISRTGWRDGGRGGLSDGGGFGEKIGDKLSRCLDKKNFKNVIQAALAEKYRRKRA